MSIHNFIELKTPLKLKPQKNSTDKFALLHNNSIVLQVETAAHATHTFHFILPDSCTIITPSLQTFSNTYSINYAQIPINHEEVEDFRYIILQIKNLYITFILNFENDVTLEYTTIKKSKLTLTFSKNQNVTIKLASYQSLQDFYKPLLKKTTYPLWNAGPGIMYDYTHLLNKNIKLYEISEILQITTCYLIIKNWNTHSVIPDEQDKLNILLDNLLQKLRINNIPYIFEASNYININQAESFPVFHLRNGNISDTNELIPLDYYNTKGQNHLSDYYKKLLDHNADGLYITPAIFHFDDEETYHKSICRDEKQYYEYTDKVGKGLTLLNDIIAPHSQSQRVFFSDILSSNLSKSVYIKPFNDTVEIALNIMEEYYRQGYTNFAFHFNISSHGSPDRELHKSFITFLVAPFILVNYDFIIGTLSKNEKTRKLFQKYMKLRLALRIYLYNTLNNFTENGILPFSITRNEKKITGFFLGDSLYCSLIHERLIESTFFIPKGNWYSLTEDMLIKGGADFVYNSGNALHHIFQKEGSIIQYIIDSPANQELYPDKIKFYIYPSHEGGTSTQTTISEPVKHDETTIAISHTFAITYEKNSITVDYTSNAPLNLQRNIYFHIIMNSDNIHEITRDEKKIYYRKSDKRNSIIFNVINKNNHIKFIIVKK